MGAPESNTTNIYGVHIRESANDGSDFSNAAADYRVLFLGEDGELHTKDSAGTVAGFAGTGIAATLADAAGDMLVASGADAWAKLATPTVNGQALQRVSGSPAWALPPGFELDYVEKTSSTNITATTEGTADTIVTGSAVSYDGSTVVMIEFFSPSTRPGIDAVADRTLTVTLYDGSSSIGIWGQTITPAQNDDNKPFYLRRRLTPSNASHTYSVRAYVSGGTGVVSGGAGGAAAAMPAFIRITKV